MRKTGIVVPCYNEAERLSPALFLDALDKEQNLSFIFVDDGSTDGTWAILSAMANKDPERIVLLRLERNSGKAEAVRRGMLRAIEGPFANVGYWDADLATPLEAIEQFCVLLDSSDVELVIGSRISLLGRKVKRNPLRHYVGRVFATFASLLITIEVYDTQCGAKIFKNTEGLVRVFASPFKVNWTFDVELLARIPLVKGLNPALVALNWYEYPLMKWVDVRGSKVKFKDFIVGGMEFCTLFLNLHTYARNKYIKYVTEPVSQVKTQGAIL